MADEPYEYEIRVCSQCLKQVSYNEFFQRWECPEHGRECTLAIIRVIPVIPPKRDK